MQLPTGFGLVFKLLQAFLEVVVAALEQTDQHAEPEPEQAYHRATSLVRCANDTTASASQAPT